MNRDYSKGKIYKISNDFDNNIYVGSTCDILSKRFSNHRVKIKRCPDYPLYKLMIEFGIDRFRIDVIEECPCQDIYELRQKEGKWIREIGTLNQREAGLSQTESKRKYEKKNKEMIKAYQKKYREENNEEMKEKNKEYREKTKEQAKEYRENNKETAKEYQKIYKLKTKIKKMTV